MENNFHLTPQQFDDALDDYAASLRQQLSDSSDKVEFLERELGNFRRNAAHRAEQLAEEKVADLRQQLTEARLSAVSEAVSALHAISVSHDSECAKIADAALTNYEKAQNDSVTKELAQPAEIV